MKMPQALFAANLSRAAELSSQLWMTSDVWTLTEINSVTRVPTAASSWHALFNCGANDRHTRHCLTSDQRMALSCQSLLMDASFGSVMVGKAIV